MVRLYERTHHDLTAAPEGARVMDALMLRGVDVEPLLHSMVGVLRADFDTAAMFQGSLRAAQAAIESLESSKPPGRPSQVYVAAKEQAGLCLATLRRLQDEVSQAVRKLPGALICFYTDDSHNIVGCKVLPLDGRDGDALWIGCQSRPGGLFNHGLFSPTRRARSVPESDRLLLVEDPVQCCRSSRSATARYVREARPEQADTWGRRAGR